LYGHEHRRWRLFKREHGRLFKREHGRHIASYGRYIASYGRHIASYGRHISCYGRRDWHGRRTKSHFGYYQRL
jgi:hypothetical protein